jgi:hypothetical protein
VPSLHPYPCLSSSRGSAARSVIDLSPAPRAEDRHLPVHRRRGGLMGAAFASGSGAIAKLAGVGRGLVRGQCGASVGRHERWGCGSEVRRSPSHDGNGVMGIAGLGLRAETLGRVGGRLRVGGRSRSGGVPGRGVGAPLATALRYFEHPKPENRGPAMGCGVLELAVRALLAGCVGGARFRKLLGLVWREWPDP